MLLDILVERWLDRRVEHESGDDDLGGFGSVELSRE